MPNTKFNLTFNKPAVRQFVDGDTKGLEIKLDGRTVMFKPVNTKTGEDVTEFGPRSRGGYVASIEGSGAEALMKALTNKHGPFFLLTKGANGYAVAEPYKGAGAPPKLEPHLRVWSPKESAAQNKAEKKTRAAPKAAQKRADTPAPAMAPAATATGADYLSTVRDAYAKLAEPRRPGRPSKDVMDARELVSAFERTASELIQPKAKEQPLNFGKLIEAHQLIGDFLARVMPQQEQPAAEPVIEPVAEPVAEAAQPQAEQAVEAVAQPDMEAAPAAPRRGRAKAAKPNAGDGKPKARRGKAKTEAKADEKPKARRGKAATVEAKTAEAPKARKPRAKKAEAAAEAPKAEVGHAEAAAPAAEAPAAPKARTRKQQPQAQHHERSADDDAADNHIKEALQKLGLEEAEPKPSKRAAPKRRMAHA